MAGRSFTAKQRRFIELFDGNGTETARKAGYSGSNDVLGITASKLLGIGKVAKAIQERESREMRPKIATRKDRQRFWTEVMYNGSVNMPDRLRAAELLGKSQVDFTEKVQMNFNIGIAERLARARLRVKKDPAITLQRPPVQEPPTA